MSFNVMFMCRQVATCILNGEIVQMFQNTKHGQYFITEGREEKLISRHEDELEAFLAFEKKVSQLCTNVLVDHIIHNTPVKGGENT